jgi:Flp pilus assembly protein TadG
MDANGLIMRKFIDIAALSDTSGSTAIEFAILGPVFIGLIVGMLYMCMLAFTAGSLQFAVADAARCYSVKTAICTDTASTQTYALNHFNASSILTPTFVASTPACGHSVTASANFAFDFGLSRATVPISAAACFP